VSQRTIRHEKKNQKCQINQLLISDLGSQTEAVKCSLDTETPFISIDCENHPEAGVVETNLNIPNLENENFQKQIFEMKKEIDFLKQQNEYKEKALQELQCRYDECRKDFVALHRKLRHLKSKVIKAQKHLVQAEVRKVSSGIFTQEHIKLLLVKQTIVRWGEGTKMYFFADAPHMLKLVRN
jgi:chromosome segregation ATPase